MRGLTRRVALLLAIAAGVAAAPACDLISVLETLGKLDCRMDAEARVSAERSALIFVDVHQYMATGADRAPYIEYGNEIVPQTLDDVNGYLTGAGINILVVMRDREIETNPAMAPVQLSEGGFPVGDSIDVVKNAARQSPKNLQSHWSPSSNQTGTAGYAGGQVEVAGEPPLMWLGMIEDPAGSLKTAQRRSRTFAHELGHYLGLGHRNDLPDNLMNESGSGDNLSRQQIDTVWETLNTDRSNLAVISCLNDPALRQIARENPGDKIRRTVRDSREASRRPAR